MYLLVTVLDLVTPVCSRVWIHDALSLREKRGGTRARKYRAQGPAFFMGHESTHGRPPADYGKL